tara:strand:+ start:775 stop:957 length:183 start_codon:yes stop_codon:yes gene_type:complete
MKNETADNFFNNVKWFNSFFSDLKILYDKISSVIESDLGYSKKSFYYYKQKDMPSIPNSY